MPQNKYHPNLSDKMVLKRVSIAVERGGRLEFDLTKLERTFVILITDNHQNEQIHEINGVTFCIFEIFNKPYNKKPFIFKKIPEL